MDKITINELKLYTPLQVFFGSCLLGPFTMIYFLWQNFKTLGQAQEARNTLIIGIVFIVIFIVCLEFIPREIPGYVIQFVYSLFALLTAHSLQMTKKEIDEAPNYSSQSPWRVLAYGAGLYLAWAAVTLPYYQYWWNL